MPPKSKDSPERGAPPPDPKKYLWVCPACDTTMNLVIDGLYVTSKNTHGPYRKFECPVCGYTLHQYLPPDSPAIERSDDFPF